MGNFHCLKLCWRYCRCRPRSFGEEARLSPRLRTHCFARMVRKAVDREITRLANQKQLIRAAGAGFTDEEFLIEAANASRFSMGICVSNSCRSKSTEGLPPSGTSSLYDSITNAVTTAENRVAYVHICIRFALSRNQKTTLTKMSSVSRS